MTPEERIEAHEQWLIDHDRDFAQINEILQQVAGIQQQQGAAVLAMTQKHDGSIAEIHAILMELAQHVIRLQDRKDGTT